ARGLGTPGPCGDSAGSDRSRGKCYHLSSGRRQRSGLPRAEALMKLLIHPAIDEDRLAKVVAAGEDLTVVNAATEAEALAGIADAEAFSGTIPPALLAAAKKLKWVQSPTASLEHYVFPELVAHPCQLTNMRGLFS